MTPPLPRGPLDRRLLAAARPARAALAASVAVGLCATAAVAAQGILLALLLASAFPGDGHLAHARGALAAGLAGALVARAACGLFEDTVGRRGAAGVKAALRHRLVAAAVQGELGATGPGEVATLAGRGLDALDAYVARCLPDLVLAAVAPVLLVAVIGALDWVSAVIVLVAVGLFPLFGALVGLTTGERARARWTEVTALGEHLVDLFEGLPVLRAFGRADDERERLVTMGERLRHATRASLRLAFLSALVLDTLASIATALVAVPIGLRLVDGRMALAPGLAALLLTPEVFLPLRRASARFHETAEGRAATGRVLDLLEAAHHRPLAPPAASSLRSAAGTTGGGGAAGAGGAGGAATIQARALGVAGGGRHAVPVVALRALCCGRPGRPGLVLDGLDLAVGRGEVVAVVGANGAGKSTLLAAVLGLARPSSGVIEVDGHPVDPDDEAALGAWRSRCSYLAERPALLPATLADNLRVADPKADGDRLRTALGRAGAAGLLTGLPGGLDTRIGAGGLALSAGQRQRVGLARALVREADCLLLDEPTAHLDPDGEAEVVDRLSGHLAQRSGILVTHRPAVLALADRVLRLEGGRLGEVDPDHALDGAEPAGVRGAP